MTVTPERIWARPYAHDATSGEWLGFPPNQGVNPSDETRYIREDIYDAVTARAEAAEAEVLRLRAVLERNKTET